VQWELQMLADAMAIVRQQSDGEGDENQVSAAGRGNSALHPMIHKRQVGGGVDFRGSDGGDLGLAANAPRVQRFGAPIPVHPRPRCLTW